MFQLGLSAPKRQMLVNRAMLHQLEVPMSAHFDQLRRRHRRLDRLIDTSKALGKQEELKTLKRLRLRLKDRIAAFKASRSPLNG